jgi:hypothetical protein
MSFKPGAGYGDTFSYTSVNAQTDFIMRNMAGSVMRQAFGELVFARGMNESRDAFGVGKGGTFTVPIAQDWGVPATVIPLVSGTAIGVGTQKYDSIDMKMQEYGTGIGYETIADYMTNINNRAELIKSLGRYVGRMINWLDYDVLVNNCSYQIECAAAGSYNTIQQDTGGTLRRSGASFGELGPGMLAYTYDTFKHSGASPVTSNGLFLAIANSRTLRNLKNGSVFQNVSLFSDMRGLMWQTIGQYMNYLFIETEELTGNGTTLFLANNAGGYGFGKSPTISYYPDFGQDANRLQVWKMLFYRGQGAIWRDKGTCAILGRTNSSAFEYGQMD